MLFPLIMLSLVTMTDAASVTRSFVPKYSPTLQSLATYDRAARDTHVREFARVGGFLSPFGDAVVPLTEFYETSPVHTDSFDKDTIVTSEDVIAFMFLNTNDDAHFNHGDSCVPVKKGNLVKFDGSNVHNTVVTSGYVKLLGPMDIKTKRMIGVVGNGTDDNNGNCERRE